MAMTLDQTVLDHFVRVLETNEDPEGVLAHDVFVDLNVPHWRYQLQGADALLAELGQDTPNGATATVERVLGTPEGFVLECAERADDHVGPDTYYRTVWLVTVVDGRVAEAIVYCTGAWDAATQARQAAEAPMIRS